MCVSVSPIPTQCPHCAISGGLYRRSGKQRCSKRLSSRRKTLHQQIYMWAKHMRLEKISIAPQKRGRRMNCSQKHLRTKRDGWTQCCTSCISTRGNPSGDSYGITFLLIPSARGMEMQVLIGRAPFQSGPGQEMDLPQRFCKGTAVTSTQKMGHRWGEGILKKSQYRFKPLCIVLSTMPASRFPNSE